MRSTYTDTTVLLRLVSVSTRGRLMLSAARLGKGAAPTLTWERSDTLIDHWDCFGILSVVELDHCHIMRDFEIEERTHPLTLGSFHQLRAPVVQR